MQRLHSKMVKSNIASTFLNIIDKCFPEGHVLRNTFNRNTAKASYWTMTNMAQILFRHNKKVLSKERLKVVVNCCPLSPPYPLKGPCLTPGVITKLR